MQNDNTKDNNTTTNLPAKPQHLHGGHRERLRKRLRVSGADNFEDHQLLEALLFFSIARKDTNDTAHSLIERFGSLASVFAADRDELITVKDIGDVSADLIKLVSSITRRIAMEDVSPRDSYNSISKIVKYLSNLYMGVAVERVYMMLFDNSLHLLDCVHVGDGTINTFVMQPGIMAKKALYRNASSVVIAHNHPHGLAIPSPEDIVATRKLYATFDLIGVQLLEHIIIAGQQYTPIMHRMQMSGNQIEENTTVRSGNNIKLLSGGAFNNFYNDDDNNDSDNVPTIIITDLPAPREDGLEKI